MQIIFHIDLNAFYASAEVSVDPTLEGKPLVISGNSRRAIVQQPLMRQENMVFIQLCHYFKQNSFAKI